VPAEGAGAETTPLVAGPAAVAQTDEGVHPAPAPPPAPAPAPAQAQAQAPITWTPAPAPAPAPAVPDMDRDLACLAVSQPAHSRPRSCCPSQECTECRSCIACTLSCGLQGIRCHFTMGPGGSQDCLVKCCCCCESTNNECVVAAACLASGLCCCGAWPAYAASVHRWCGADHKISV
jgi:hypothetical protein